MAFFVAMRSADEAIAVNTPQNRDRSRSNKQAERISYPSVGALALAQTSKEIAPLDGSKV
ncbi:MAG TPA: hypothetical protein DEG17_22540 [Cyanobacteria bacterium UBA11149]|nr:hypothetical protein [Cyanobacteria bacterium UBA11367]HBE57368.1 hypothetical protein [Cyanobacteria bacterium UBA11366]HBK65675.1 hypothetical protein [Cyanobacteria bacterium UBA11166]HBR74787.1 hypothetical protein [Cyanobacteria bacterium UBA11159]HBS70682.1 hypothetical protein [Cyanobacteria bacterium UBA11153]HBW91560.1 hypothetical protein [Cyanobacteria bacterium UBA11149]HCA94886.1 hypothetical protein [Cyanobacteria bacterium UBA9226]